MRHLYFNMSLCLSTLIIFYACAPGKSGGDKIVVPDRELSLWNGADLSEWELFLPDSSVSTDSVWRVQDGVIKCSGKSNGYMRTKRKYKNYTLNLDWRWPAEPGNSGVLLHMDGDDKVWPKCIEAQLKAGNAGDFYLLGGTTIAEQEDRSSRRIEKKAESSEKTAGQWNRYEITCTERSIRLEVNGIMQNTGTDPSVNAGYICLQSEGRPIEFRNINLSPCE